MPNQVGALKQLLAGNRRFVRRVPEHPNQDAVRRAALAPVQHPFAVLFGCSDSRLAAEIIFDQGLGDLLVVRTAGHVIGPEVLGSVEYGISVLNCPLIVVLGHDSCGAIAAARDAIGTGAIPDGYVRDVVERVASSVMAARALGYDTEEQILDEHITRTVELLLERSRDLADQVAAGRTALVGLAYGLADGSARLVTTRGLSEQTITAA